MFYVMAAPALLRSTSVRPAGIDQALHCADEMEAFNLFGIASVTTFIGLLERPQLAVKRPSVKIFLGKL